MNENNDMNEMLEFRRIKEMLVKNAMTEKAAQRFEQMEPFLDQARAEAALPGDDQRPGRFWMHWEPRPFRIR